MRVGMYEPDAEVRRWLAFVEPSPKQGARRTTHGCVWEYRGSEWVGMSLEPEHVADDRQGDLLQQYARMQRERVTDFSGVLPDQYAQEVPDGRGGTRVDYVGVPIKNADGTLNKHGKALIEAHETPNRRESELAQELNAVKAEAAGDA